MQQEYSYAQEMERISRNLEKRISRLQRDFWIHKEQGMKAKKAALFDQRRNKPTQLDLFAG